MYNEFFGLRKKPFNMTPDPGFLFLTSQHREALAGLTFAVLDRKGFVVLTGDAGTGKTTLLTRMLRNMPANRMQSSVILHPTLTPSEFLELTLLDFGISDIPESKAQRLMRLQKLLLEAHKQGKVSTLVVDEAHKLSVEVLEEIRLLGNFEEDDQKLLQILLVGQKELNELLDREDLRQLKQRIALRFALQPIAAGEVERYIQFRWTTAGGAQAIPFSAEAVALIGKNSEGVPRVINALCDNSLMLAFASGSGVVTEKHVKEASNDLRVGQPAPAPVPPKAPAQPAQPVAPASRTVAAAPAPPPVAVTPPPAVQVAAPPAVQVAAVAPTSLRTLDRYTNGNGGKPSFRQRWARLFGLVH